MVISSARGVIDHFTVVCMVAWPLNDSDAGVGRIFIEIVLLFLPYLPVYKSTPILEPKNKFLLFLCKNFLEN